MAEKSVFEQIKKQNGEAFAKAIRSYDNGIFDVPNIVNIVKYAGRESEPIMKYLISLKDIKIVENETIKDPFELLSEAGYDAYYVHNLEEQNQISKYFEFDEMLCTFRDPIRFQRYHIINAVKKNVAEIQRKDFVGKEQREDAYGTSVISIQIATQGGFISIKNRYNHTVINPDNTFNSNPDNIISGLSNALKKYFQVDFSSCKIMLPHKFISVNNQIVLYHIEKDNIYFGDNFYAKDGRIFPLNKDTEIMLDTCILNLRDRTLYDPSVGREPIFIEDVQEKGGSFIEVLACELKGKKLRITKNKDGGHNVYADGKIIVSEKSGEITALNLPNTIEIGHDFLRGNEVLQSLDVPNLKSVGDGFLEYNNSLQILNAPNLIRVGNSFLKINQTLQTLHTPELKRVGNGFLGANNTLQTLELPNLTMAGDCFLNSNNTLQNLEFPNLTTVDDYFLNSNNTLQTLIVPKLTSVGDWFLRSNNTLQTLNAPELRNAGHRFLNNNNALQSLDLPNLRTVCDYFLNSNNSLQHIKFPNLITVGDWFLNANNTLQSIAVPNLRGVGDWFLSNNKVLQSLDAPNLITIRDWFLSDNNVLQSLELPNLKKVGYYFLKSNNSLQNLDVPNLTTVGDYFLAANNTLQVINAPNLIMIGDCFLSSNNSLQTLNAPQLKTTGNSFLDKKLCLKQSGLKSFLWKMHCVLDPQGDKQSNYPSLRLLNNGRERE